MAGESDLGTLLKGMSPHLEKESYYLAAIDESQLMSLASFLGQIKDIFREEEGLSIIFSEEVKDDIALISDKEIIGPFALITMKVHSDLYAAGFLAKITAALAKEGISANAFSPYHHDYVLVPYKRKDDAMQALERLSKEA